MNSLLATAIARPLKLADLDLGEASSPEDVRAFCDSFAYALVDRYLRGDLPWTDADIAANHIYELMIQHCGDRVPDYAWDVYLAFDVAECTSPGGDTITRPLIEDIARRYGTAASRVER